MCRRFYYVGTQLVLAVESWRTQHQEQLQEWIDCWAEFEALNAIACYSHEHPADTFPDFIAGTAVLEAEDLGHPLLPAETCVRNHVSLHEPASPFYVVSGSNMAGKSTFLKAVGVNTVLALAGAPWDGRQEHGLALSQFVLPTRFLTRYSTRNLNSWQRRRGYGKHFAAQDLESLSCFLIDEILTAAQTPTIGV